MSTPEEKINHGKRLHKEEAAIKRQVEIAKQHGLVDKFNEVSEPHRFAKHHAMDNCVGDPEKFHSSHNPRKDFNELTIQEQRLFQDVDTARDRHSNGL